MSPKLSEEMSKCGGCKKAVSGAKKYYRNGRYYCNPNCWKKAVAKAKADAAEAAA